MKSAQIIPFNARLETAWANYIDAKVTAEITGSLADGIAMGRAHRRFLDLFLTSEQRGQLDASVIGFRR